MKLLKRLLVIVFALILVGCSSAGNGDSDVKPFKDAGNQTFTMSQDFFNIINNNDFNFYQIDENDLLLNDGGLDFYIYNIKDQQYKMFTVPYEGALNDSLADLIYDVNYEKAEYIYQDAHDRAIRLMSFSGNVLKEIDGYLMFQIDKNYFALTKTDQDEPNTSTVYLYDRELNLQNTYPNLSVMPCLNTGDPYGGYGTDSVPQVNPKFIAYDRTEGKLYTFSDGDFHEIATGLEGTMSSIYCAYSNGTYLFNTTDGDNPHYYAYHDSLVDLGENRAKFTSNEGTFVVYKSDTEFDFYDSQAMKINSLTIEAGQTIYPGYDSYLVYDNNSIMKEYSYSGDLIQTYVLDPGAYDYFFQKEPFTKSGQFYFETINRNSDSGFDIEGLWFKNDISDPVQIFKPYYNRFYDTLAIVTEDMSKMYVYQGKDLIATINDKDIIECGYSDVSKDRIVSVKDGQAKFYSLEGELIDEGRIIANSNNLSTSSYIRCFPGYRSYSQLMILMDADNLQVKLIS